MQMILMVFWSKVLLKFGFLEGSITDPKLKLRSTLDLLQLDHLQDINSEACWLLFGV